MSVRVGNVVSLHLPRLKRMSIVQRIGRAFNRRLRGDNDDGSDNQGLFTAASQVELGSGPSEPGRVSREQGTINGPMERHGEVPARGGNFRRETVIVDVNGDTFNCAGGVARHCYPPRGRRQLAILAEPFSRLENARGEAISVHAAMRGHVGLGDRFNRPSGVARNWYAPREMRRFALAVDPFDNLVKVSKLVELCIESVRPDHAALGSPSLDV